MLLLAVAALLTLSALLAVGILLFGDFGETEGRILGTTALLAGYGLLAVPAAILLDRRRARALAEASLALAVLGAGLALAALWSGGGPEALGQTLVTVTVALAATAQTAALAARLSERDPRQVRVLFVVSAALAAVSVALAAAIVWTGGDHPDAGRVLGAVVVLDALAVALQPLLARTRIDAEPFRLRIRVDGGETVELSVEARDLAAAAAKAIRLAESDGRRVVSLEPHARGRP